MPYLCLKVNYTTIFRCDQTLVEFPVKHHNDINTLLVCFVYQDSLIEGVTQVYSAAHGVAQCIEAHTTTFVTHKFTGNLHESVVLCAASRLLDSLHGRVCTYMSLKGNTIHVYLLLLLHTTPPPRALVALELVISHSKLCTSALWLLLYTLPQGLPLPRL